MPELPEVQTVVTELNRKLRGRKIKRVVVNSGKIISVGPKTVSNIRDVAQHQVDAFVKLLTGRKILGVKRRAKMLIFDFDGPLAMLAHLKMTGQFIFEDQKQKKKTGSMYRIINNKVAPLVKMPSKYTHVVFYFTDNSVLYFNDVRQFGYLKIVRDSELEHVRELNDYGPEPLDKKFTLKIFADSLKSRGRTSIKQAITDPKLVAGIGNIYSDEILFHARVLPGRKVSSLSKKEIEAVYKNIRPVLEAGIKHKGSSVGDFIRTDGSWGSMGKFHFVYGRGKQACKRCGTMIKSIKLGGRTASFCPRCQK